jgi:hypothetical protein
MNWKPLLACMAITGLPVISTAAFAEQGQAIADAMTSTDELGTAPAPIVQPDAPALPAPIIIDEGKLSDDDLLQLRGGQAIVVGNQTLTAISNGNAFNGNYSAGDITLADNALSNFNGLGNLLINTGAQNNLQSAMNVTINIAQ